MRATVANLAEDRATLSVEIPFMDPISLELDVRVEDGEVIAQLELYEADSEPGFWQTYGNIAVVKFALGADRTCTAQVHPQSTNDSQETIP